MVIDQDRYNLDRGISLRIVTGDSGVIDIKADEVSAVSGLLLLELE